MVLPEKCGDGILRAQALVRTRARSFELEFWGVPRVRDAAEGLMGLPPMHKGRWAFPGVMPPLSVETVGVW